MHAIEVESTLKSTRNPDETTMSRILVVEDDREIAETIAEGLREDGFTVDIANDGAQALKCLEGPLPAVIVLDLMMPVLNGPEFVRRYRGVTGGPAIPIIAISAGRSVRQPVAELGVQLFIPKPFDLPHLLQAVAELARSA
jgi:two-component system, OmpR family, response regulator MprA